MASLSDGPPVAVDPGSSSDALQSLVQEFRAFKESTSQHATQMNQKVVSLEEIVKKQATTIDSHAATIDSQAAATTSQATTIVSQAATIDMLERMLEEQKAASKTTDETVEKLEVRHAKEIEAVKQSVSHAVEHFRAP